MDNRRRTTREWSSEEEEEETYRQITSLLEALRRRTWLDGIEPILLTILRTNGQGLRMQNFSWEFLIQAKE